MYIIFHKCPSENISIFMLEVETQDKQGSFSTTGFCEPTDNLRRDQLNQIETRDTN